MDKLKIEEILKPGAVPTGVFLDNTEMMALFENARMRQEEMMRLKKLPFKNLTITI